jgi:excinuclease ABC subunit C
LVGQFSTLKTKLEADMKAEAKKLHFEQANIIKKQLFALDHLQDVALISSDKEPNSVSFRIEAYDIAHLSGTNTVGGLAVWQNGDLRPSEYRRFKIKGLASGQVDDLKNLAEILTRRLAHVDWPAPDLIVVDGDERIRQVAMKICQAHDLVAPVVAVVKDDKHKAAQLLGDTHIIRDYHKAIVAVNLEVHRYTLSFHRKLRSRMLK